MYMDMENDFWKNGNSFLWSEEIIVIEYNLVSFLHNCIENISVQPKCNVLFYIDMIFLIDWKQLSFINYLEDIKSRKSKKYINENPQNLMKITKFVKMFNISKEKQILPELFFLSLLTDEFFVIKAPFDHYSVSRS